MSLTMREIVTFLNTAGPWLKENQKDSKLRYGIKKVLKQCQALYASYLEQLEDLDIEHCSVGKDDVILKDERGQLVFTKDGLRKRNAARKQLFEAPVTVTPHLVQVVPEGLTEAEREAFQGFVLPIPADPSDEAA